MSIYNPGPSSTATVNQTAALTAPAPAGQPIYTYATLPPASSVTPGTQAYTSDQGPQTSNGYAWTGVGLQGAGSGIFGYSAQNTPKTRAGIARVKSGQGNMKIAHIGDSTTLGAYANGSAFAGDKPLAWPAQLSTQLTAKGIPATNCSWFGSGNVTPATAAGYTAYNPAVTFPVAGFAPGVINVLGGFAMASTTSGATLAYTPENSFAFDTADIYYCGGTGGAFTVNVDGGSTLATITPTGTHNIQVTTVTGITLGTHTLNCVTSSATGVYIAGMAVRASATKRVENYNMGITAAEVLVAARPSTSYAQPTSSTYQYNYFVGLPVVAPDLTFIDLTVNDINNQGSSVAVYQAALQTMVNQALISGDCVLMVGNPGAPAPFVNGTGASYIAAVYAVAAATGVMVIDLTQRWTSYAVTNPTMPYGDAGPTALHPGTVGHADIAVAISALFN